MPHLSQHIASSTRASTDAIALSADYVLVPNTQSPVSGAQPPGFGALILKTFARARAAILNEAPPSYARGAWAIINDVPYPPPPPYASSRHPPTYDESMEIGVVASPLRVEQQMQFQSHRQCIPRVASAPQLGALVEQQDAEDMLLPGIGDCELPRYEDVEDTVALSPVVQGWRLGESAFEKPPMHPKGYVHPSQ
ncbi:hypothetical protein IWW50_005115 [Coemansia erecta]|nr:hypothetical protein GGF43_006224 [Coemansia sp. RSA 2618]KAJ2820274.1 hypothetical protein IWW50_005115 [Coemansia erecta]